MQGKKQETEELTLPEYIDTEELANFIYDNQDSDWINFLVHPFGLEVVHRKSGNYIRKTPDRYQGLAKETAALFGAYNHDNAGMKGKVIKNGRIYSVAPMAAAAEFAGTKIKPTVTLLEKISRKIDEVVPDVEPED